MKTPLLHGVEGYPIHSQQGCHFSNLPLNLDSPVKKDVVLMYSLPKCKE